MSDTLSIIIPVYNCENYLHECLASIVNQEQNNIEIILIDDGSTDKSGVICDSWTEKYCFISTEHVPNRGVSAARNLGIKRAKNDYVLFVDSDDRIAQGSLPQLSDRINQNAVDIYFLTGKKFYEDGSTEILDEKLDVNRIRGNNSTEVIKYLSAREKYPGSACTKAFRRDFLITSGITFPEKLSVGEDLTFTLRCLLNARSFDFIECDFYEYRQRTGPISSSRRGINQSFWSLLSFIEESIKLLCDGEIPKDEKCKYALSFVSYEYSIALLYLSDVTENADDAQQKMKELSWVQRFQLSTRGKIITVLTKILGVKRTSRLLVYAYNKLEGTHNG